MKSTICDIFISVSLIFLPESNVASCFAQEQPRKYDEFGNVTCEYELTALDRFSTELQNYADAKGYVRKLPSSAK